MTQHHTPDEADNSTVHNVPDGLLDSATVERPPTSDTPFVPPYAEHVETAPLPDLDTAAFAFADIDAQPVAPPTRPRPAATSAAPAATSTMAERARRWGAPAALVVAGLLGGMALTGAVTNASASTPASTSTISDAGSRGSGSSTDSGSGLTLDQLDGTPDADNTYGDHDADGGRGGHGGPGDGQRSGGRSVSDGFTLAPGTQGTTGASS